jgi:hypothetical protein
MIAALLFAAAASSADADSASLAYVQCLFAQSRLAHESRLSPDQFEAVLARRCRSEERALFEVAADASAVAQEARQIVVNDYRRILELEPDLKRLAELCRAHPDQCRDWR